MDLDDRFFPERSRRDSKLRDELMECSPPRREAFGDLDGPQNAPQAHVLV